MILFTICTGEYVDPTDWASYSEDIICQELFANEEMAEKVLDKVVENMNMEKITKKRVVTNHPGVNIVVYIDKEVSCF